VNIGVERGTVDAEVVGSIPAKTKKRELKSTWI